MAQRPPVYADTNTIFGYFSGWYKSIHQGPFGNCVALTNRGEAGLFTVYSRDDLDNPYFVESPFTYYHSDSDLILKMQSSDGTFSLSLDSLNAGINRAVVFQSIFPVIQDEFDIDFVQIGPVFTFALHPFAGQLEGMNTMNITLRDSGLSGVQISSLAIYKWDAGNQIWHQLETDIDAEHQPLSAEFDTQGTYAVFGRIGGDCIYISGDSDGNARQLTDVTKSIAAYRGPEPLSGCLDCPGQRRLLPRGDRPLVIPSLKSKIKRERWRNKAELILSKMGRGLLQRQPFFRFDQ